MLEAFLLKPFLAVLLITICCALFGVFVLWKKISYFGDALSHAVLLGLILGAVFDVTQIHALALFSFVFAILVKLIENDRYFSKDTIIMIASYFCIALAIIINDIWVKNFNFSSYVFGDVLTVSNREIRSLLIITAIAMIYTFFNFKKLLLANVNRDLAQIEGVKIEFLNLTFLLILSLIIALSVRIVGVFLMTALLILPAAIARIFSASAKQMIFLSVVFGIIVSTLSFIVASQEDLTISSAVICGFCLVFIISLPLKKLFCR